MFTEQLISCFRESVSSKKQENFPGNYSRKVNLSMKKWCLVFTLNMKSVPHGWLDSNTLIIGCGLRTRTQMLFQSEKPLRFGTYLYTIHTCNGMLYLYVYSTKLTRVSFIFFTTGIIIHSIYGGKLTHLASSTFELRQAVYKHEMEDLMK